MIKKMLKKILNRERVSYLVVGALTTILGIGSFAFFAWLGTSTAVANTLSTVLAVLFAFVTNKIFVFRSEGWGLNGAGELVRFLIARGVTFVAETALLVFLVDMLGLDSTIMKIITTVLVILANYVLSKWFVFEKSLKLSLFSIFAVLLFLTSLAPIVWVGLHARPSMDDYSFAASSSFFYNTQWWVEEVEHRQHHVERSVRYATLNGNVIDVSRAVWRTVADNYRDWQGTFTAIALFSMHPGVIFGQEAYPFITLLLTMGLFMLATAFLCRAVFKKHWLIPWLIVSTISIQFVPHLAQGFFWYNGAMLYTFFYSMLLISLAWKWQLLEKDNVPWLPLVCLTALDFLIGGGNQLTALLNVLINICFVAWLLYNKKKNILTRITFTTASIAGLAVSVFAPGNANRMTNTGGLNHAVQSIVDSITLAARDIASWTNPAILLLLLIAVPFLWRAAKELQFSFKWPLVVVVFTFLLFASQNTPALFAQEFAGPPRLRNIVFFSYVWLLFGNTFYLLGWVQCRFNPVFEHPPKWLKLSVTTLILCFAVVLGFNASRMADTLRDIQNGELQHFIEIQAQRQALLLSDEPTVQLPMFMGPLSLLPWWDGYTPFLGQEVGASSNGIINRAMADYYGKDYITALPPPRTGAFVYPSKFAFEGRQLQIDTNVIMGNRYIRLRDFAQFLAFFDVEYANGVWSVTTERDYRPVGGELRNRTNQTHHAAYLYGEILFVDGAAKPVLSYSVDGEIFFMIRDLADALQLDINVRYGVIELNAHSSLG